MQHNIKGALLWKGAILINGNKWYPLIPASMHRIYNVSQLMNRKNGNVNNGQTKCILKL